MQIKILHKYILKELIKAYIMILAGIVTFILISSFLDEVSVLLRNKPAITLIYNYYLFKIPFYCAQAMPFAMLFSILLIFSNFNRFSELTAMKAAGIDFYQIVKPILIFAIAMSFFSLLVNETIVSKAYDKAKYIKDSLIEKKVNGGNEIKRNLAKLGSEGRIFYVKYFDSVMGIMKNICVLKLDKDFNVVERLDADQGTWQKNKWLLTRGVLRTFVNSTETSVENFKTYELKVKDAPSDFIVQKRSPEDSLAVNVFRLMNQIKILKQSGFNYQEEEVNFYIKLAFPFATFIMAILGVSLPFLFSTQRSFVNAAIGFIFTVIVSFFYMGFITIGMAMGNAGQLPAFVAGWISNFIFLGLGLIFLWKVKR